MISRLGRFDIQAEIGRGGFGQVFYAHDPLMNRVVAVKVLTATEDASSFNRFKNEATAAGNLRHGNIVTIYEFGQEGDVPFLVMEYLNGEDLHHLIKNQTPLSLYQKVRIMDQVADGLHCAHVNGVLHRDVKPANIMVLKDGAVKIMDFGIARLVRDTSTRLTQQGYLIGTVVYMAPELFAGTEEVDALCDIWSYGVVMYELLSGKNPFQTGSLQSEMFRIVNRDADRLPPEICPPELQAVISKLLTRERELRYQTLEEARFDLEPILNNLRKAEADRLVSVAQQFIFQMEWNEALDAARGARKMDPQNGSARIIFEHIQGELRKQSVHPRVSELLMRSNQAAEQRKIPDAINHLEAALKFGPNNEMVLNRLQELRSLKVKLDEASRLVNEAGNEFRAGHLTGAFERASEAVALDPDNQEVRQLFESIQSAIRVQEVEHAVEADIRRARGLMAIDDMDGALATLKAADARYPGRSAVRDMMSRIAERMAEREQRREFSRRLENAKAAVRGGRFEEAILELEQLLGTYPHEGEVADLLGYARQELKAKERSVGLKRITDAAAELNRKQEFCEAIRILEEGLKRYPDDLTISRLVRSTHVELQNYEREAALREGFERCEALRRGGQWQEALNLIALLVSDNPNRRELADLDVKIRQEKNQAERKLAIRNAIEESERLLGTGQMDGAVNVLEAAGRAVGPEPEIKNLLKKANEARQAKHDGQYIQSELKHAKVFEERGDVPTSLKIIEDALRRSPKSQELLAAKDRLISLGTRARREQDALEKPDDATILFPSAGKGEPISQLVIEGRRLLDAGRVEEAEQFLATRSLDSRDLPELVKLERDIAAAKKQRERQREVAEYLRAAQESERKSDLAGAVSGLQKALKKYPADPELSATEKRVRDAIAQAERKRQLADKTAVVKRELERGNWKEALKQLAEARAEFLENPPELDSLDRQARELREREMKKLVDQARGFVKDGNRAEAEKVLKQQLAPFTGEPAVAALANDLKTEVSRPKEPEARSALAGSGGPDRQAAERREFAAARPGDNTDARPRPKLLIYGVAGVVLAGAAGLVIWMRPSDINVSPEKLSFAWQSGARPAVQTITVTGSSDVATPQTNAQWVTVTRGRHGSGKTEFQVQVSPEKLAPGSYTGLLTFSQEKKVMVDLVVPQPGDDIRPASLTFPYSSGGVPAQTIVVTSATAIPDPTSTERWVTFTRRNLGAGKAEFLVQVSGAGLAPGQHSAFLSFPTGHKVPVELIVPGGTASGVYPAVLAFPSGGQQQKVTFMGPGDIPDPTASESWLTFTRGSVAPGRAEFLVQTSSADLDPGKYDAYLIFPTDRKVHVELTVPEDPGTLEVKPESLVFSSGGPPQTITVTGPTDIPNPTITDRWVKATRRDLGAGIAEFDVQTSAAGLVAGPHVAYLNFSTAKKVRVVLNVPPH